MGQNRHQGVLPTTLSFAVYMFLLMHQGGSDFARTTPGHMNTERCLNYCPSADQFPEECIDCVSGFYGPGCRRGCRGHCLNGQCALLANGQAINCTEGCVLGWRGLTCNTKCKLPCLECDRYTGGCVEQCRDGFCGDGCLQRCPYPHSTCDKSCETPMKLKMTHALGLTQGSDKEGSNENPCTKEYGKNCVKCGQCSECLEGYYGSRCDQKCIGNCQFDCDIQTGLCRTCKDGFRADNCSVPCSKTCSGNEISTGACERSTGACHDGCSEGYCSPKTGCDRKCVSCSTCDFETCKCLKSSASSESTSTTHRSPVQGIILAVFWIFFILNTMYLIISIIYCYEKTLWTSITNYLCHRILRRTLVQTDNSPGRAETETPENRQDQDEPNTGSSWCNCPQSPGRKAILMLTIHVIVAVSLNVILCVMT